MCKTMFLFGSGADTDANGNLESGQSFAKSLLLNEYADQIKQITGIKAKKYKLLYHTSRKIYVQSIMSKYNEETYTFDKETENIFGKETLNQIKVYNEHNDEKVDIKNLCDSWYELLKENNDCEDKQKNFFLNNAVFFDSLDEKFNSLRNNKLNSNAKRVVVAYWNVYLQIFNALYVKKDKEKNIDYTYEKIFETLKKNQYVTPINQNCYYKKLKESKLKNNNDYFVSTTNYTSILNEFFHEEDISWLHGRLNWFEDLKNLQVYDCNKDNERDQILENVDEEEHTVLPFILIPSGVKPLICKKQINEFSHFIDNLESCNRLVVVGYRFNSEDNHINSIIGEWLAKEDKQLLCFLYDNTIDIKHLSWLPKPIEETIEFKEDGTELLGDNKVLFVNVNKNNAREAFEQLIKELENKQ